MTSRDDLRIGDAERDEVMAALREHFARGRLTYEELDERLDSTLAARTAGDLRRLTADLPEPSSPRPTAYRDRRAHGWAPPRPAELGVWNSPMAEVRRERIQRHRRHHGRPPVFLSVLAIVLIVSAVAGSLGPLFAVLKVMLLMGLIFAFVRMAHHRHHHRHPRLGRRF
ncbi:DUF1707 domain-containing protein [Sphaerisporangium flaviroseum]|uniref:DUF1707 SHOCT-like domain-containing protein n=1 Tax=Sphaerisporangium flaviroseum TaxID=509199 RepID=UPI0031EF1849